MKLEYGPMPNVMAALSNISNSFLVPGHKVWLRPTTGVSCL